MGLPSTFIVSAQNVVAGDDDETPSKRPCLEFSGIGVAYEQMTPIGRNHQCVEGISHRLREVSVIRTLSDSAPGCRVASGKLSLNSFIAMAHIHAEQRQSDLDRPRNDG